MNNVGEKFLPLGTVVMLKGASKRLMITGFCTMAAEEAEGELQQFYRTLVQKRIRKEDAGWTRNFRKTCPSMYRL